MNTQKSTEIKLVVDRLNEILDRNLTLVTFDELCEDGEKALVLLNDLLEKLTASPEFRVPSDKLSLKKRMKVLAVFFYDTLKLFSQRQIKPVQLLHSLSTGNEKIIHSLIFTIVKDFDKLKLRFYLSQFVQKVKIPQDIRHDDIFTQIDPEYTTRIDDFKKIHRIYEKMKSDFGEIDPDKTKQHIQKLQKQVLQLKKKIGDQRRKIKDLHPNWEKLIEVTDSLREEMAQEQNFIDSSQKQQGELSRVQKRHDTISNELDIMKKDRGPQITIDMYLQKYEDEVKRLTRQRDVVFREKIKDLKRQHEALENLMNSPNVKKLSSKLEVDISNLQEELMKVNDSLKKLESAKKNPEREDKELKKLRTSNAIFKKKVREKRKKLDNVKKNFEKEENMELSIDKKLLPFKNKKILSDEQYDDRKRKFDSSFDKVRKQMDEVNGLKSELAVLQNTLETLKETYPGVQEFLEKLGENVSNVTDEIVSLTEKIQDINIKKEESLAELSKMVKQINSEILSKEKKLAPKVQKLNRLNKDKQNLEVVYNQKKADYENLKASLDMEQAKKQNKLFELEETQHNLQGLYHQLQVESSLQSIAMKKVESERKYKKGLDILSANCKTYGQMYGRLIKDAQQQSKDLLKKKVEMNKSYESNVGQIKMFKDLRKLLEAKIRVLEVRKDLKRRGLDLLDGRDTNKLMEKTEQNEDGVEELNI